MLSKADIEYGFTQDDVEEMMDSFEDALHRPIVTDDESTQAQ